MQMEAQTVEAIQGATSNVTNTSTSTVAAPMEIDTEKQGIKVEGRGTKRTADGEPASLEGNKKARTGTYFFL